MLKNQHRLTYVKFENKSGHRCSDLSNHSLNNVNIMISNIDQKLHELRNLYNIIRGIPFKTNCSAIEILETTKSNSLD